MRTNLKTMTPLRPHEMEAVLAVPLEMYFGSTLDQLSGRFYDLIIETLDSADFGVRAIASCEKELDLLAIMRKEDKVQSLSAEELNAVKSLCGYRLRQQAQGEDSEASSRLEVICLVEEIRENYSRAQRYAYLRLLWESKRMIQSAEEIAARSSGYRLIGTSSLIESLALVARIERKLSNHLKAIDILKLVSALKAELSESNDESEEANVNAYASRMANPTIFEREEMANLKSALSWSRI